MSEQFYFLLSVVNIGAAAINVIALIDAVRMRALVRRYRESVATLASGVAPDA